MWALPVTEDQAGLLTNTDEHSDKAKVLPDYTTVFYLNSNLAYGMLELD